MVIPDFFQVTLGGLVGSGIATALFGAILLRRNRRVESEIKSYFDQQFSIFQSRRAWKEQAITELFGPLVMQLDRTLTAAQRWNRRNLYLEGQIVRLGNQTARDLLLSKGHLVPPALVEHATRLIVHYDVWMEEFDRVRSSEKASSSEFVFVGPAGYPFPTDSEAEFKAEFRRLQHELYDA